MNRVLFGNFEPVFAVLLNVKRVLLDLGIRFAVVWRIGCRIIAELLQHGRDLVHFGYY